jgi:hypothetical protein
MTAPHQPEHRRHLHQRLYRQQQGPHDRRQRRRHLRSGGSCFYDADGNLVLKDPGQVRFAFEMDYNGTPGDPSDDVEVPDSFRLVAPIHREQRLVGS